MLHNIHRVGVGVNDNRVHTRFNNIIMFGVIILKIRYYYGEKIKTNQSENFQKYGLVLVLPRVLIDGACSRRTYYEDYKWCPTLLNTYQKINK